MLTITVRTYRPGDEPAVRKGGAVLPSSNAVSEAARRDRGRTTLAAIAAEAGVSLPTVSKVVNGRRDVAPATRALVERLLHEHQYTRAGTRRHRRSGLIDLVFNGLDSPWAVEILRGVEEWGTEHSTAVAVSAVRHGNARPASWTSGLASHDTDGVILVTSELTGSQLEQLREADIPLVVLDPGNPPPPDLPSVGAPIRRCPKPSRCSVAARPPAQFVAPTLGRSGGGGFPGSRTTSGMSASRSCSSWLPVSSEVTRITPSVSWLASPLVQLAGRALPCRTAETATAVECSVPHSSTPRKISTAHGLSSPLNTRSMRPDRRCRRVPARVYWCSWSSRSTSARVAGATSRRPFTTFETVGSDTPASAAIAARVVRPRSLRAASLTALLLGSTAPPFLTAGSS